MKYLRDWRIWAGVLAMLFVSLVFLHSSKRFSVNYAEMARSAAEAKGWKNDDLIVSSVSMTGSPFTGDDATVIFQIGNPPSGKKLTVMMRRSVFGPPTVESMVEN